MQSAYGPNGPGYVKSWMNVIFPFERSNWKGLKKAKIILVDRVYDETKLLAREP